LQTKRLTFPLSNGTKALNVYPIAYFPPIPWFVAARREEAFLLEVCQHYRKQQITNRMWIKGPNRALPLTIPVERRGARAPIRDKKISYAENWQKQHWYSWIAAYRNSPYFEYYEDDFRPLFEQKYVYLVDLLTEALGVLWQKLDLALRYSYTEEYHPASFYGRDFRMDFQAGLEAFPLWFQPQVYPQVFPGFTPGLSIVDLLFNEGPNCRLLLDRCYQES
jgi:hypothetical protein